MTRPEQKIELRVWWVLANIRRQIALNAYKWSVSLGHIRQGFGQCAERFRSTE